MKTYRFIRLPLWVLFALALGYLATYAERGGMPRWVATALFLGSLSIAAGVSIVDYTRGILHGEDIGHRVEGRRS